MKTLFKNKDEIVVGDTIIMNGEMHTMGKESFGRDEFLGRTIRGDSFALGYRMVEVVVDVKF